MKPRGAFQHRKPSPTKASQRVQLVGILQWRENLDSIDVDSLARCYRVKPAELRVMIAEERNRRAGRALG